MLVREKVLKQVDREVIELLEENMKKLGLNLRLGTTINRVIKNEENGLLTVETGSGELITSEKILVAIGRKASLH